MTIKLPYYLKATVSLFGLILTGFVLYIGQDILVPLAFAVLLAILLLPLNTWMEKHHFHRVVAIPISIVFAFLIIGALVWFMSMQVSGFINDLPTIKKHVLDHYHTLQTWLRNEFNITNTKQNEYLNNVAEKMKSNGTIEKTLGSFTDVVILVFLLPIYTFLMLYYRGMIKRFFMDLYKQKNAEHVEYVFTQSKVVIQNYMVGLMIELAIVTGLNAAGFMIVGINYAVFLAFLAAVLNVIPYIGMMIAYVFCILITLSTSQNTGDVLGVIAVLAVVQFLDNNILMPKVVGSKVKINALITIISVLVGGAICGVSGMFIAIPGIAILKTIFDRVEDLKPWGVLLGDDITVNEPGKMYKRLTTWKQRPSAIIPQKVTLPNQENEAK